MSENLTIENYINTPHPIKNELITLFNRFDNLIILDIGACEAEDSIRYSHLFPMAKIFAFEPVPENVKKAEQNILHYNEKNITIVPVALCDVDGETKIYLSEGRPKSTSEEGTWDYGNKSSSILPPEKVTEVHEWLRFKKEISVKSITLKNFFIEKEINIIDFVHLDVQGAELLVLKGAGEYLKNIKAIWLEVEEIPYYKNQPLKKEIETFMKSNKFIKIKEKLTNLTGDQLYINRNYFDIKQIKKFLNKDDFNFVNSLRNKINVKNKFIKNSYSQCGEDIIIKFIFDTLEIKNFSWIDIGANHPYKFNNTALFYTMGQRGINIEPDPEIFNMLNKNRNKDKNLNIGIGKEKGTKHFYIMSSNTLNTFSKDEAEKYEAAGYKIENMLKVEIASINDIVRNFCNNKFPELLSIDVEGFEEVILRDIRYDTNTPLVICIETISFSENGQGVKNSDLINFLKQEGYLYYADTYINSIFVKKELWLQS